MRKSLKKYVTTPIVIIGALIALECGRSDPEQVDTVEVIVPEIVRVFPHDTAAFTQGLIYQNNYIFESTGLYGHSTLRKIDPSTGEIIQLVPQENVFAEGLCWWEGKLVQLTWRENVAMIYEYPQLDVIGTFSYDGEGWGLTRHDDRFIMSDGSATLTVRDDQFYITDRIEVTYQGRPLNQLNELESARGSIYANVWYSDMIFQIDPSSGSVVRIIDCSALVAQANVVGRENVLNGIAWREDTQTFFITGKRWPVMFEVRIPEM
ncbi:MAG: glutaminyl-peptide cyclotransferase [Chitinispirillaceae bacterium]